jgi:hydroxyethylthiazole kinase
MAHARNEVEEMASLAAALVLNIGTLTDELIDSMLAAGAAANTKKIPVVLDVCGAGATRYRDEMCAKLIASLVIAIIKGNGSEILRVAGRDVATKGVDSSVGEDQAGGLVLAAESLARKTGAVVVVTGKTDIIAGGEKIYLVENGAAIMGELVGTGCMAASVIGTFAAVEHDYVRAAAGALCCYGVAGELAAARANGPAQFKMLLHDSAYLLSKEDVTARGRIR